MPVPFIINFMHTCVVPKPHPLHQQNQPGLPDFSQSCKVVKHGMACMCTKLLEDTGCQYGQDRPNRTVEPKVANYVRMSSLAT